MIPSLVAEELKEALVEYLATTFALTDDEAYAALTAFLRDESEGIFRGPYLRVRLPFVDAPEDSDLGVVWTPEGFSPYAHQLEAWQRLAGRERIPEPTLITTGTGSGKSEAFLIPILDHCLWARRKGQRGVKALLLYPMNALVTDQQRRVAKMLAASELRAAGVTGGVWIGDDGSTPQHRGLTDDHLITDPDALRDDPPDILLTNYKMLDRLLTNESRQRLWAANTPPGDGSPWQQPLRYLVLDEIHTYDGAQGTDVAMLLRRLGSRLGTATDDSPLDGVGCVGTSATLGSAAAAAQSMCGFATKVFGVEFDGDAVIGEKRQSVAEVCPNVDLSLPVPNPALVAGLSPIEINELAQAFTGEPFDDPQLVGDRLLRHPVTANLLRVASGTPRTWPDVVTALVARVPEWAAVHRNMPGEVEVALERFVGLVSRARGRTQSGGVRPLFSVEVQVWIREVTRLKRALTAKPAFRWADSAPPMDSDANHWLPSVYCTACGRSGWMTVANRVAVQGACAIERLDNEGDPDPYQVFVQERKRTRVMMRANADEGDDVLFCDPEDGQVYSNNDDARERIPVLVGGMTGDGNSPESRDEAAKRQQCPACGTRDTIRFLGSKVTTLASVGITQMFGSQVVADDERKLLAFTDSVQDASHRAAFFSGRTHRFNLRATLSRALQDRGRLSVPEVAAAVLELADATDNPADAMFSLVPPDLLWEERLRAAWEQPGTPAAADACQVLAERLSFDAIMEVGLRSRLGRTLETTGTAVPEVVVTPDEWDHLVAVGEEALRANAAVLVIDPADVRNWLQGMVERLRLVGGIYHPFLDNFVATHGKRWEIWGGSQPLAPKFPAGLSAPRFFATGRSDDFQPVTGAQSWLVQWTRKTLGVSGGPAELLVRDGLELLTEAGVVERRSAGAEKVWGLPAARIDFVDVPDVDGVAPATELRCAVCSARHYTTPDRLADWVGRPCLRMRCPGVFEPFAGRSGEGNYYRQLYREGRIRRVVAAEHTGLLTRRQREDVEEGFKRGSTPDAPNVLAATPTLEMGIDIGDLSAVMLTAVPPTQANYVQRVGRAGRATGNAFITTFAEADPRSLYFLHDPHQMIAGEITPPDCYLDAIEILRRQYLAFLIDQAARRGDGLLDDVGEMPRTIDKTATAGMAPNGWLRGILTAGSQPGPLDAFLTLFGGHLDAEVTESLRTWTTSDFVTQVERVLTRWTDRLKALQSQIGRLRTRDRELSALVHPSTDDLEDHARIKSELRHIARRVSTLRKQDTLGALEGLGLLPNYTLFDDTVTLEVNLYELNEDYDPADESSRRFATETNEYARGASVAIRELAPGNFFYVNAHRVRIDAVDVGTESEPAYTRWRLCPECAWAVDTETPAPPACPRCGASSVAGQQSLVNVLPLRAVSSTQRESTSRVGDDSDERDSVWHELRTSVDVSPDDIAAAYMHTSVVFGVEFARGARIRYLNLGPQGHQATAGRKLRIDGRDSHVGLFRVCRLCGGVFGIRGDTKDSNDKRHHRTWCKVRSGARKPAWDDVALAHELSTETVRMLLPVAEFEAVERTTSFKAALLLGLRDSFGGEPSHLRVLNTEFPAANDPGQRIKLVVVHDTVPGGTGYLPRLADPDRLESILRRAVDLINSCDCQNRGLPACHKCLYGSVDRLELPRVTRRHALDVLGEILTGWELQPADQGTITGVNLAEVRQSELERMFKAVLQRWAETADATLTALPDPEAAQLTRFDLRFPNGSHWQIREQVNLAHHGTIPDFYATRLDTVGTPDVAIYLDGFEYHGARPDQIDHDAERRRGLHEAGLRVWTLTWDDVEAVRKAQLDATTAPSVIPLPTSRLTQVAKVAREISGADAPILGGEDGTGVAGRGAFGQLLAALEHPEPEPWRALAAAVVLVGAQSPGSVTVEVDSITGAIDAFAFGDELGNQTGDQRAVLWQTAGGQMVGTFLRAGEHQPRAVVSYDTEIDTDKGRWSDWLHLGNLVQYLDERATVTSTRSHSPQLIDTPPAPAPSPPTDLLDDVLDAEVRSLAAAVVAAGITDLEVGFGAGDDDDTPIEVAWPTRRVGILAAGVPRPVVDGWDVRPAVEWSIDELLKRLGGSA